jgi:ribosomal protein S18 acetylase RimI-like enzyme
MSVRRGQPPDGYYTAAQAKKRLGGISDGMFRVYIQEGKIERFVPPGMKQGFYKREDVNRLAREIESSWYGSVREPHTSFRQATPADIGAIADIDERTFNASEEEPEPRKVYMKWDEETYLRWMRRNNQTFFVLCNTAGKVVGFAALLPLKKDTMDRFVRGKIKWMDIPDEAIDLFEPGIPLHLYVIALCVDPIYKDATKKAYGAAMINGLFSFIMELANRGVEIETITARNELDKPDGKNLLQKLGIPQLRSPVPHMHLFSVKVADSGYPLLIKYSDALAGWKHAHKS